VCEILTQSINLKEDHGISQKYQTFDIAMFAFVVGFLCSVLSQEIGWEERLRNDLFCVTRDVNLNSVNQAGTRGGKQMEVGVLDVNCLFVEKRKRRICAAPCLH